MFAATKMGPSAPVATRVRSPVRYHSECRNDPDQERTNPMQRIATVALLSQLAIAALSADDRSTNVRMKTSGDSLATTINLQDHTITDEERLAGDGTLGSFTYHGLRADFDTPQMPDNPSACSTPVFVALATGTGVFRFDDGSLLVVNITGGGICIDLAAGEAQVTENYVVASGTGRFEHASGNLTFVGALAPVVFNAAGNPQLLTMTGRFEGTVSGIGRGKDR
jgi:hypothetical protein